MCPMELLVYGEIKNIFHFRRITVRDCCLYHIHSVYNTVWDLKKIYKQ